MARMPDLEAEAMAALGWLENTAEHPFRHAALDAQPSFAPAVSSEPSAPSVQDGPSPQDQPSQQEEPMALADELNALSTLATRLDSLGDDKVTKLESVLANPDGNRAFEAMAALSARGQLSPAASAVVSALEALAAQP